MSYLEVTKRNLPQRKVVIRIRMLPPKEKKRKGNDGVSSFFIFNPYAHLGLKWDFSEEFDEIDLGCCCMGYESGGFHDVIGCEYDK